MVRDLCLRFILKFCFIKICNSCNLLHIDYTNFSRLRGVQSHFFLKKKLFWNSEQNLWKTPIVPSRVSAPPWNFDLTPFYLVPPPPPSPPTLKKKSVWICQTPHPVTYPLWATPSINKILFSTMKWEHIWMLKYAYTVAKSKNQRRVRLLVCILCLLGS